MLLTVDIGNSAVGATVFRGKAPIHVLCFATPVPGAYRPWSSLSAMCQKFEIEAVMVSSVVPSLNRGLEEFLRKKGLFPRFLDHRTPLEITLAVDHPHEVGADRIADVVGALEFTSPPFLVIDSGTALTVDVVDAGFRYLGGVIAPGVEISIRCLAANAARLENIEFVVPVDPLGRNTADCIRAGVFYTHLGGLDYIVREFRNMVGKSATVIATGGAAELFNDRLHVIDRLIPDLIHHGLRRIHAGWMAVDRG
ncbi:MAG TPA: type III pantothenate kinase [Candidatus Aminicenantes bacterium]|nr:type III pantothenate kinase [Candidatus Aminicenantes bacterium]